MTVMGKLRFPAKAHTLLNVVRRAQRCDSGTTAIEYSLIGALIAMVIIGGVGALGTSLTQMYAVIQTALR